MRHAKSSWNSDAPTDHARPLNKRGCRDAPRVARRLAELGWTPDVAWSSDSERTRQTWGLMAPEFEDGPVVTFTSALYHAGLGAIQEVSDGWPDEAATVLVLGHNPGWEDALTMLSGRAEVMTTANAGLLVGEGDTWSDALERGWDLEVLIRPRELAD